MRDTANLLGRVWGVFEGARFLLREQAVRTIKEVVLICFGSGRNSLQGSLRWLALMLCEIGRLKFCLAILLERLQEELPGSEF